MTTPQPAATSKPAQRLWLRIVRTIVLIYVVWCAVLYIQQDAMVFPTHMIMGAAGEVMPGAEVLERAIDEGTVRAWYMPTMHAGDETPAPLVIFFHGNAELIDHQASIVSAYRARGVSVLLPEYRGYGHSDGKPSQRNIVADAVYFYDQIVQRPDVDSQRIIFHGRSIGGAVAAQVAAQRTPAALITESAPANIAAMAWGFGVPPLLVKHPFRTDQAMRELDIPILLFHGALDGVVPVSHGRRLHQVAPNSRLIEFDCDHNDFPGRESRRYWEEIDALLEEVNHQGHEEHQGSRSV